jgi:multidrug efflux pump subunit AcrA (membrane-fusion protein)
VGKGWLAAALVGAVAVAWLAAGGSGADGETAAVRRADLVLGVEVSGTLEAVESALLGPPQIPGIWNYKIAQLAAEGTQVSAGQPVMRFDTSDLERRLLEKVAERDSAETELDKQRTTQLSQRRDLELRLAQARARLRKAELEVDVPEEIIEAVKLEEANIERGVARREVAHLEKELALEAERAATEIASQVEKRDRAAARVKEIEEQIHRMTVIAPRPGTVIYVTNWRDEKKKVGDTVWQQEKVIEIPDMSRMRAEGEVDEADAGRVEEGQRVTLRLDAHPDAELTGTVRRILRTVRRQSPDNPLKVVRLEIDLDATDPQRMRPGMRFRGEVEIGRLAGVLVAPAEAVFSSAEGPVAYRTAGSGGGIGGWWSSLLGPRRVHPVVGERNQEWVEVRQGLEAGDRLLLHPPEGVEP